MNKKVLFILGFLVLLLLILFIKLSLVKSETARVTLNKEVFRVTLADEPSEWARGLSFRKSLASDEGMFFLFPDKARRSFWMKDMNFSLDIIWLDEERVIGWVADVPPPKAGAELIHYSSPAPVNKVLELPAGTVARLGLKVDNLIHIKYD